MVLFRGAWGVPLRPNNCSSSAGPSKDLQQAAGEAAGAPGLLCSPGGPRVASAMRLAFHEVVMSYRVHTPACHV